MKRKKQKTSINEHNNLIETDNSMNNDIKDARKETKSRKEERIKFKFLLNNLDKNIVFTETQREYINKINSSAITFCIGPAGSGKTISACYALLKLLFEQKIKKIIFTKPIKESGESLGFLPGDIQQKIAPYAESFIFTCTKLLSKDIIESLIEQEYIENKPLAYMRGCTFDECGLFLDEGENVEYKSFMLYMTRLGKDSKMIIAGDIKQSDIDKKRIILPQFMNLFKTIDGIAVHEFTKNDIMRNKILIEITEKYEEWKDKNNL